MNVDPEDPVHKEKVNNLAEQVNVYNQIMKDAQNEIKMKEVALKEIDDLVINSMSPERKVSCEKVNYNFMKKKGKSPAARQKLKNEYKRISRASDEGKMKNRETAKRQMSNMRETVEGKEINRKTSAKIRSTDDGKEKNRSTAKQGMSNIRETDEGKEKNRENAKQEMSKIRKTDEGKEKIVQLLNKECLRYVKLMKEKKLIVRHLLKSEMLRNQKERKHLLKFKEGAWLIPVFLPQKRIVLLKMTG